MVDLSGGLIVGVELKLKRKKQYFFFIPKSKESHVIMVWGMEAVEEVKGSVAVS